MTIDDQESLVLIVAASRDYAASVMDYFRSRARRIDLLDVAQAMRQRALLASRYRLAIMLDPFGNPALEEVTLALAPKLPCLLVSDRCSTLLSSRVALLMHTRTPPQALYAAADRLLSAPRMPVSSLVGEAPVMQQLRRRIEQVAATRASVLVLGEAGSGKEAVAREIHRRSGRRGAFVILNCATAAEQRLDAELFGHERGAFPGAFEAHAGHFERADGGTLFLDEVEDMSSGLQARVLRTLQRQRIERVGGGERAVDVRVVTAALQDLQPAVEAGRFRADLYYRLAVFPIQAPALREHPGDIPAIIQALVPSLSGVSPVFDDQAWALLANHDWPGNVRELVNVLERLSILYPGDVIGAAALQPELALPQVCERYAGGKHPAAQIEAMTLPDDGLDLKALGEQLERRLITQALRRYDGVVARAARGLGLRRTTLIEKMRRYDIGEP